MMSAPQSQHSSKVGMVVEELIVAMRTLLVFASWMVARQVGQFQHLSVRQGENRGENPMVLRQQIRLGESNLAPVIRLHLGMMGRWGCRFA
jgi:hypothetical protein